MPEMAIPHEREMLLQAAVQAIKNHGVETELLNSSELPDFFFNGVMIFNVLNPPFTRRKTKPDKPPMDHGIKIAALSKKLGLGYVVLSAGFRKDLSDGGASYLAHYIREIKKANPNIIIEAQIPEYSKHAFIENLLKAKPDLITQSASPVKRLHKGRRKLRVESMLRTTGMIRDLNRRVPIRATLNLSLNENMVDVVAALKKLRKAGVDMVLIGKEQAAKLKLDGYEHLTHQQFELYESQAYQMGYRNAISKVSLSKAYAIPEFISSIYEARK